jgi:hypothetical protein
VKRREETNDQNDSVCFVRAGARFRRTSNADLASYQPDGMITQARMGCGAGMVMVNGACVARTTMRHARRCARWNGGVCAHYY